VDAGGVVVHIVQLRAGLIPARHHGAHAQAISAVLIPEKKKKKVLVRNIRKLAKEMNHIVLASNLEAAATEILSLLRNS
jgi:hypothetical protein